MPAEPYRDTSVAVERSKEQIRKALRGAGVRFDATPLDPEQGARGGWKVSPDQRERQAWRGLAWYIESLVKAAAFGIVPFEAVFLAYFEDDRGRTIGERLIPSIENDRLGLPAAAGG